MRSALHLEEHRHLVGDCRGSIRGKGVNWLVGSQLSELDLLLESVTGNVDGDLVDHGVDGFANGVVVGIADEGQDGVAHDEWWLGWVEDDDGLAAAGPADGFDGRRGGLGELVDVRPGSGASGPR